MFPHLSPWELHYKCLLKPSEQGFSFLRWSIWGVTCLSLLWKNECFSIYPPWKPHKYMLKPSEQWLVFPRWSIWGVTCLGILSKWTFPIYLIENCHEMCVETLRKWLHFYEMVDLRGHMPRFTLKNECFPIYLLGNTHKCVLKPSEQGSFFWDDWFEGSNGLGLL